MSYLALARKWRPRTFSQLVGQEHVVKVLVNSLTQQRLHHAYLFTGTRGVGKTSVARILAKSLNCEQSRSAEPCLQCDACLAIEQGRFVDLIEIDGASKTRVEDTRELLENVQYSPVSGRFKIYLIDEVHMLSQHSFNALLKTLEEPPSHVKFLLATTDPQKLPLTVLSRCLQFHLRHLSPELVSQHLQHILTEEEIRFESHAVDIIASAAKGSMRDGLSLLDQAIASCHDGLTAHEIKCILGYPHQNYAIQLLQSLLTFNAQELIQISRKIAIEGGHFRYVLDELLDCLHQLTVSQHLPGNNPLIHVSSEMTQLMNGFSPEDIQLFYQIGIKGLQEMYLAPTLLIGFEMVLLRMLTFRPAPLAESPKLSYEVNQESVPTQEFEVPSAVVKHNEGNVVVRTTEDKKLPHVAQTQTFSWKDVLSQIPLTGLAKNAAKNAEFMEKQGGNIVFRIEKGHQSLFTPAVVSKIEESLTGYYHEPIRITLHSEGASAQRLLDSQRQQQVEDSLHQDAFFQQLKQGFSAELIKNSITPLKDEL